MVGKPANDPGSWSYTGQTPAQITSLLSANNARLIDLDHSSDGSYNASMVGCGAGGCPAWSWYTDQSQSQMQALAMQNAGRIIHTSSYAGCGGLCYAFILVDNSLPPLDGSSPITSRVGQLLRAGGINGVQGLYLKQVGGPVLANLEESFVYEPASSIKVLAHLYAMTQVQNGAATLADSLQQYTNGPESCPDPAQPGGMEKLSTALQEMMWHSDNARTREITAFGLSIGMQNTNINHIIGCGGPVPDQLTLADAGVLYEGVANGTLLTPANQSSFASLMAGKAEFQAEGYDWTHLWDTDIPAMIAQAAPAATQAQERAYQNMMNLAYKAGNYVICSDSCSHVTEYIAITGWVEIPFCSGGAPAPQDYVFGLFLHGPTDNSYNSTKTTVATQNFLTAKGELLREQITAGLASCGLVP
jgi:X-X-X-Leu-X-X-Gly heptad repeat protein